MARLGMHLDTLHPYTLDGLRAMPWKNGGGITREVACWRPLAGMHDFDWRVSIATIAEGGPFSVFPGVDRVITLLQGDGVRLRACDGAFDHRLDTPLAPFAFSGDLRVDCELLGGASSDFNVMTRRGVSRAEVSVLRDTQCLAPSQHGVLLAVRGRWTVESDGEPRHGCGPDSGLWWAGVARGLRLACEGGDAALIAVRIQVVGDAVGKAAVSAGASHA